MSAAYRHTQTSPVVVVGLAGAFIVALWMTVRMVRPIPITVALLLACLLLLFFSLTVQVDEEAVDVAFGAGLIRRRIPLRRITHVEVVRNPWYYGWGIRLTPHGWLWNLSGLGAVQLTFDDGRRFRIGSDEPERLARAVNDRVAVSR